MPVKFARRPLSLLFALAASAVLLLTLLADNGSMNLHAQSADTPTPVPTTAPDDDFGVQNLPHIEGKLSPPKYANMDSNLNRIVEQVESGQTTARGAAKNAPLHSEESVAVTIYITEGYADAIVEFLEANGASPRNVGTDYIEAYVPVSLLPEASEQEGVISVRTIIPPQPAQGTVVSEGVTVHGATVWHNAGLKGQGVKIGIIDTGFEGFSTLQGTELPATVEARCYTDVGVFTSNLADCTDSEDSERRRTHGTAVAEALFDIAPEATYYISNTSTSADLRSSVDWMIEHDVEIINMSAIWSWGGPGDGTSRYINSPLKTVDAAVEGGAVWINAAGNSAKDTWYGPFADSDLDGWHNFFGEDECNGLLVDLEAEENFTAQLRWDDSWTTPATDLDLYLSLIGLSGLTDVVGSEDDQTETSVPFEAIFGYSAPVAGSYCLSVFLRSGVSPDWIQLQSFTGQDIEHHTLHHSIGEPADSANTGLLAVGAAPWNDSSTIEEFSSRGPTHDNRIKPEVVGADGGQSVTRRSTDNPDGRWGGTSQASPHVAGLAALVIQRSGDQDMSPAAVADYLKRHAEARGAVPNNTWGYGFARLLASDAVLPEPTATPGPTATPIADSCVELVGADGVVNGSWSSDCESSHPDRSGHYARYYTFSLTEAAEVTITLESSTDPYLYLREDVGRVGTVFCENDDYTLEVTGTLCSNIDSSLDTSTDSGMVVSLAEGAYTIEATTYVTATTGDFTLTASGLPAAAGPQPTPTPEPSPTPGPSPSPTPVPLPPDHNIEDAACNADDLTGIEGFSLDSTDGPHSYDDFGYHGIVKTYVTKWVNADDSAGIVCAAVQYNSIENARWSGLNYSAILQRNGASVDLRGYEQDFIPSIGDDMLAYKLHYHTNNDFHTLATVRFLDASTITLTRVTYHAFGTDEYSSIAKPEGIAKKIAARVIPTDDATSQSESAHLSSGVLESFDWNR